MHPAEPVPPVYSEVKEAPTMLYIIAAAAAAAMYILEAISGRKEDAHPARPWME